MINRNPDPNQKAIKPDTAKILAIVAIICGAIGGGIDYIGGCCCGWIGWPLILAALVCGALGIIYGGKESRTLAIIGIAVALCGFVLRLIATIWIASALSNFHP